MTNDVQWFAGIDWASQAHGVCLVDTGGKIVGERTFAHGGAGLAELWIFRQAFRETVRPFFRALRALHLAITDDK